MTLGLVDFKNSLKNSYDEKSLNRPTTFNVGRLLNKEVPPIYISKYLPLEEKIATVNAILSSCNYQYGMEYEVYRKYYIIKKYISNVRLPQKEIEIVEFDEEGNEITKSKRVDSPIDIVDVAVGVRLWDKIMEEAGRDIFYIDEMLDLEMKQYRHANNIARLLENILFNINEMVSEASEKGLTNVVIEQVSQLQSMLGDEKKSEMAKNLVKLLQEKQS